MSKKIILTIIAILVGALIVGTTAYAITGTILNADTRVRKNASTDSEAIDALSKGEKVEVEGKEGDWYKVKYNGNVDGYIRSDLLDVDGEVKEEKTETTEKEEKQEEKTETTSKENTSSKNSIKEGAKLKVNKKITLKISPIFFLSSNGTISEGEEITIAEILGRWCRVEGKDNSGWIYTNILNEAIDEEQEEEKEESEEETSDDEEDKEESDEDEKEEEKKEESSEKFEEKKMYVKATTLNVRKEASAVSTILDQLSQNDVVTVTEKVDNIWSKIKVNNLVGYVATEYLSDDKVETSSRGAQDTRTSNDEKEEEEEEKEEKKSSDEKKSNNSKSESSDKKETSSKTTTDSKKESSNNNDKKEESKKDDDEDKDDDEEDEDEDEEEEEEEDDDDDEDEDEDEVTGEDIVRFALKYEGYPYVYATSGPNSFDCSGFTSFVYRHFGYTISRSSEAQKSEGKYVSKSDLKPGDILCFTGHVGLYIGDGEFIHASTPKSGVIISELSQSYYKNHYIMARRIIY